MPKKRAAAASGKKAERNHLSRAAHDKRRVDGLFDAPTAPATPKEAKKKKAVKKKKVTRKTKPTYFVMIKRAIDHLNQHHGSSLFAIYKYLEDNYPVSESFRRFVGAALRKGVADGYLSRNRMSYKLTAKGRAAIGKSNGSKMKKKKKLSKKPKHTASKRSTSPSKKKATKKSESKKKTKTAASKKSASKGKEKGKEKAPKAARATPKTRETSSSSATKKVISPAGHKFRWQYQDGTWKDYEINGSDLVETAYQGYIKNPGMCDVRSVKSGQWQYQVDFLNLKQTNIQHESHTTRAIRRLPLDE